MNLAFLGRIQTRAAAVRGASLRVTSVVIALSDGARVLLRRCAATSEVAALWQLQGEHLPPLVGRYSVILTV